MVGGDKIIEGGAPHGQNPAHIVAGIGERSTRRLRFRSGHARASGFAIASDRCDCIELRCNHTSAYQALRKTAPDGQLGLNPQAAFSLAAASAGCIPNSAARPARARRPSDRAYVSAIITSNIFAPSRSPILILIIASSHPDRRATFGCDLTHGRLQKRKFQKSLRSPGHLSLQINAHVKILWDCQRANTAYRHQRHRQL